MRVGLWLAAFFVLGASGCSQNHQRSSARLSEAPRAPQFVRAPAVFRAQCLSTARAVGYPVPCPLRVPPSFVTFVERGLTPACKVSILCPGTGPWRGWVLGSSQSATQHLAIEASPRPLRTYTRLVYGAGRYPPLKRLAWVKVGTRRMQAFVVPPGSGSLFGSHVVLIWTVGQHTYGVGFHNFTGVHRTLLLDLQLMRHITLVRP